MSLQNNIRLQLTLLTVLLVADLVGLGWLNFNLLRMDSKVHDVLERQWKKVQLSNEALRYSAQNNRITMEVFLLKDQKEIATVLAERSKNTDRVSELLRQIEQKIESEDEKKLLSAIWARRLPYVDSYKEALALLLDRRKYEEARVKMIKVALPKLAAYHEAWETFVQWQWKQMNKAGDDARVNLLSTRRQIGLLLGLAGLIVIGEFLVVLRWIRSQGPNRQNAGAPGQLNEEPEPDLRVNPAQPSRS